MRSHSNTATCQSCTYKCDYNADDSACVSHSRQKEGLASRAFTLWHSSSTRRRPLSFVVQDVQPAWNVAASRFLELLSMDSAAKTNHAIHVHQLLLGNHTARSKHIKSGCLPRLANFHSINGVARVIWVRTAQCDTLAAI
eukprot:5658718-Amphidinium_carterae.1